MRFLIIEEPHFFRILSVVGLLFHLFALEVCYSNIGFSNYQKFVCSIGCHLTPCLLDA